MMSCHICKSTERKRGDFWYFVQDCFKINSTSFQHHTYYFFPTSPKISQFYWTSDRRVKCKGSQSASTRQCKSRSALTISVRLNHTQRENNRLSFGTFSGPNLMLKLTSRRGPDGQNWRAGFGPRARLCRPLR